MNVKTNKFDKQTAPNKAIRLEKTKKYLITTLKLTETFTLLILKSHKKPKLELRVSNHKENHKLRHELINSVEVIN